jgi:hypothetical protein
MSTVALPENRSAALAHAALPTPLFTRHMFGAIEAERDRRRAFRAPHRRRTPGHTAMAHPRIAAVRAAEERRMTQARVDYSRWANEGGRFDPEAAARLRIGDREMKRCNS